MRRIGRDKKVVKEDHWKVWPTRDVAGRYYLSYDGYSMMCVR